jgi:subtilisin family serine protease
MTHLGWARRDESPRAGRPCASRRQRRFRFLRLEPLEPRLVLSGVQAGDYDQVSPAWFAAVPQIVAGVQDAPAAESPTVFGPVQAASGVQATRWIVRLTEAATDGVEDVRQAEQLLDGLNADFQVLGGLGLPGQLLVRSFASLDATQAALTANPYVASFSLESRIRGSIVPDDPQFGQLLGMENTGQYGGTPDADIDAPAAWDITTGSRDVVVAVVDTGIDYYHPDLAANVWTNPGETPDNGIDDDGNGFVDDVHGYDFHSEDGDPRDDHGHGTHVAGTIAAVGNNGLGVTGINWVGSVMALKFLDQDNSGFTSDAVRAINYATMMRTQRGVNVRVLNNSWGSTVSNSALEDAIRASAAADILVVAAAGNGNVLGLGENNDSTPFYPASYGGDGSGGQTSHRDHILAVAATGQNDELARFSNYGVQSVDIAAPGVGILSTTLGGGLASRNGTSMAAPQVSGVAALVWSVLPDATASEVRAAILAGADPKPSLAGKVASGGRLNAYGALTVDKHAPRATLAAATDVTVAGGSEHLLTITYRDNVGVNPASLDDRDIQVTCLTGQPFQTLAALVSIGPVVNGSQDVVYRLTPPGGVWDSADNGTYQISLQANQVADAAGNAAKAKVLGTFLVEVSVAGAMTVDTTDDTPDADPGDGEALDSAGHTSLRAAIMEANASLGLNTITLPAGTYTLRLAGAGEDGAATGDLDVTESLNVCGAGAESTIIDGGLLDRVFQVLPGITVNISGVTITGGTANAGGGLRNQGWLNLEDVVIRENRSTGAGGGILNEGTLAIKRSTLSGNSAAFGGGGVRNTSGVVTITDSTLSGNEAQTAGGGVQSSLGSVSITNSTLSGNAAVTTGGGIQLSSGSLFLTNVTVTANTASDGGGVTIAAGANGHTRNTILAGNAATSTTSPDVLGPFASDGNNLVGIVGAATGFAAGVKHDQVGTANAPIDPLVGPLQDNGGATATHALGLGSPAIDAGNDFYAPAVDQRGRARPEDGDNDGAAAADIGAVRIRALRGNPRNCLRRSGCRRNAGSRRTRPVRMDGVLRSTIGTAN